MDSSIVGTLALTRSFPDAFELLADIALHPTFPNAEIERVRREREAALVQEKDDPFTVATRVMRTALYEPHHPYGYPDIGTAESLKTISRDDLLKFWQVHYFPKHHVRDTETPAREGVRWVEGGKARGRGVRNARDQRCAPDSRRPAGCS